MKSPGKHRAPSTLPRTGAAVLMVGGLVVGTVTAASASPLKQPSAEELTSPEEPSPLRVDLSRGDRDPALQRLGGQSLAELRAQPAADRSIARSAPDHAEPVETMLGHSSFPGTTIEEEPAPVAPSAPVSAPDAQAPANSRIALLCPSGRVAALVLGPAPPKSRSRNISSTSR